MPRRPVNGLRADTIRMAQQALGILRADGGNGFYLWLLVGEAHRMLRIQAALEAGTIHGRGRNTIFSRLLTENGLLINGKDRTRLKQIMANLPAVVGWRESLPEDERMALNNPTVVWAKFGKHQR